MCEVAKQRTTVTYGDLATELGLKLPRQNWSSILDPLSTDSVRNSGRDLTLVVVYKHGPAKGLSRYFSNVRGGETPRTKMLNPRDPNDIAAYKRELEKVYDTYAKLSC